MTTAGSPEAIAAWMLAEVDSRGKLYTVAAAAHVDRAHGAPHVGYDAEGLPYVKAPVLDAFRALSGDYVVWSMSGLFWRRRRAGDQPGREQK